MGIRHLAPAPHPSSAPTIGMNGSIDVTPTRSTCPAGTAIEYQSGPETLPPKGAPMQGVIVSAPPRELSPVTIIPAVTGFAVAHVALAASGWIVTTSSKVWGAGGGPPGGTGGMAEL